MNRKVYTNPEDFFQQNEALDTGLPYVEDVSILSAPLQVGNKTIRNRLACQAMEGCDGTLSGEPDVLTKRRYDRFARGGAGIIWFEATAVMKEGRANPRQLYMDEYNFMDFAPLVEEIKETCLRENGYEPTVIVQLTHSGRYSKPEGVPAPLIAYNNPICEGNTPIDASHIVSDAYLDRLTEKLSFAAALAERAGFDGCDIKCCHRYLNSELLTFPLVFCGGSDLIYQCYIFFLKFVLRGRLNFPFFFPYHPKSAWADLPKHALFLHNRAFPFRTSSHFANLCYNQDGIIQREDCLKKNKKRSCIHREFHL